MEQVWSSLLNETDQTVIMKGGYGKQRGLGRHPALFVLDMQMNLAGRDVPIAEQLKEFPMGAGERAYRCVEKINELIAAARKQGIPVIYTKHKGSTLMPQLLVTAEDYLLEKECDSAFYGTTLQGFLTEHHIDTVLITGAGTSTAGRATAVDAITRTYNLGFVQDCLFDRMTASHQTACLDIWMKFGDIMDKNTVLRYLDER